ncbi:MAG: NAD(P)-dependent alcohol dehydrogenase [Oceanospirillaceae bacterium]|nr:NAD(P)-dependent alcohol dehydrogenase [Oceanospirillaceae bacterium]
MKAIYQLKFGKPDVLQVGELPLPKIKSNEVLIHNQAASVNPRDCLVRAGKYQLQFLVKGSPLVLGSDCAGTIVKVGSKVKGFQPGDRVYGMKNPSHGLATYAEYVAIAQDHIATLPENISFIDGASIPLCALTAWQGLVDQAHLKKDESVLVIGASGGVGVFATQLANIFGANVTGVCSGDNADLVASLGAHKVINYRETNLSSLTSQYDVIFDAVGSLKRHQYLGLLNPAGRYVTTLPSIENIQHGLLSKFKRLFFPRIKQTRVVMVKPNAQQLRYIAEYLAADKLKPVIDSVYECHEAQAAHTRSQSKRARGKIVIKVL